MKTYYSQKKESVNVIEEDYTPISLMDSIEKTRIALDIAYAGFDNAVEIDLIDSYIYEINSLQRRYKHLTDLAAAEAFPDEGPLSKYPPVQPLVGQVLG